VFASRDSHVGAAGTIDLAFTDRHGGVSPPPYDTLDLSRTRAESQPELAENFRLLARAFDVDGFATMHQVQGADVAVVTSVDDPQPAADGLVTSEPDVALCVRVGDCVPVVLADPGRGVVAVAHAGRRGVVAGVVPATVTRMRACGAEAVIAWVGPHVCGDCYEVPAQMRTDVATVVPAAFACTTKGSPSVDLGAAVTAQLTVAGCVVVDRSVCTLECADFYSYRRDGRKSGRFAGIVVRRLPNPPGHATGSVANAGQVMTARRR
jgi:purine-nucleoside/S-methyl-5'-thioadenosine phosphorylase / adenosine deaminase